MPENNTVLDESILNSIKKLLGVTLDNTVFDDVIALHINTVLANLISKGIGPQENGYQITSSANTWNEFLGEKPLLIQNVKSYVYIKVKLLFDPPQNNAMKEAFESQAKEIEYLVYTEKGGY